MNGSKPFWASTTLWGAVGVLLGIILPSLGIGASPSDIQHLMDSWVNLLNDALTFGGLILTIYGRFKATKQVSLTAKVSP